MASLIRDHKGLELTTTLICSQRFYKDQGLEAIALGDLVAKVRKELNASHDPIDDTPLRLRLPASIIVQALRMAQALRIQRAESTMHVAVITSSTRDQVLLMRACVSILVLYLFLSKGGSGIDCLTEDLVAS
jgi:hypothetical protein